MKASINAEEYVRHLFQNIALVIALGTQVILWPGTAFPPPLTVGHALQLPDGTEIQIGPDRFKVPEVLFQPVGPGSELVFEVSWSPSRFSCSGTPVD